MNIFYKVFQFLILAVFTHQVSLSQTCPSINAQAGTGASTTICSGQCASLTATIVPVKSTSSYSVGSIPHSPFPYSGGTAAIGNIDDLWSPVVNIGFNFCYFGNTFNQLLVGSNGEITFDVSLANGPENFSTNIILPNVSEHPGNTICVSYRDIDPSSGGSSAVFTYTTGVAPCRKFIAYWSSIPTYSCTSQLATFQVVLHEGTNIIETYISSSTPCASWQSGRGLMGIQNATGTTAVAPSTRNVLAPWTATNEAWQYMPTGANTFTVNWSGPSGFTATGLTATACPGATSNYTATLNVSDCSGTITSYSSAVQVSVTPTPTMPIVATPTAVCRGSSSVLSATGATSYSWMPGGATTASISVSPTVTTTYTLTRINGSCSTTQTISLVVNANPTVTATRSTPVLCSGGTATLTGGGASTYIWNPGGLVGTSVTVSPTITTQYTVTGTTSFGCTGTRTISIAVSTSPTITASASSPTACSGSALTLSASGGNTYNWMPGSLSGASVVITPTVNTTYTVTGTNAAGCTGTNTVSITVTPGIDFTATATPSAVCSGQSTTLTATGVTSYTWLPGPLTGSIVIVSPASSTQYTVTGSNGGACTATKYVSALISVPNINATRSSVSICAGSSATLSSTGGVSYTWAPGGMTGTPIVVTPTSTTVYTVTGTNAIGCTNTKTISISVLTNPTASISATSLSLCPGFSSTLTASGGTSYTWTPGSFTTTAITVTPSASTIYSVNVRNASGCISTGTLDITVFPATTISPVSSPTVICSGSNSTLTATGASTYTWNPGALTGSNVVVSPSVTTNYSISGTDMNGCTGTATIDVTVSTISLTATSNPTILCSSSTATLTGSGASTYTWSSGSTSGSTLVVTPASTTIYTLTGTDTQGCTASTTLNLSVGVTPTVTASASSPTVCEGTPVTLSSSGATTYTWLPGALTGSVVAPSPSVSTTYTVNGENSAGCIGTNTVFVFVNPAPVVTASNTPAILCSGNNGTLTASGASTYTWNPGNMSGSTVIVAPLSTTVYTVVGTSTLNCTGSATVNLKVTITPTISASSSPTVICEGNSAVLSGGGAFTYTWNPGALIGSTVSVSPSVTTTYTLTGDNGFGCISTNTVVLNVNPSPTITASASPTIVCSGFSSTLTANGGSTYTWMPGSLTGATVAVNPLSTTIYTLTGVDALGCSNSETVTLSVSNPTITAASNPTVLCSGGNATLTAIGASTYTWSPVSLTGSTITVTPTITTTYSVSGTDGLGCINTTTIDVVVSSNPTLLLSASSTTICAGSTTTLTGNGAATYTWNPGSLTGTSVTVNPSSTTTYTVDGNNGAGCIASETITINVNSAPSLSITATPTVLCVAGSVTLTASGANTYTWNPTSSNAASIVDTPSLTTTYTVTGADIIGCTSTETISVNVGSSTITASANPTVICSGQTTSLSVNGASSYTWNPGSLTGSNIAVTPSTTTTYTVDADNGAGCITSETLTVVVNPNATFTLAASANTICSGLSATLTATGASSYTWNPGALTGTMAVVAPSVTTIYTVTGSNGTCSNTSTISLTVNATPTITATSNPTTVCIGNTATLTGTGASTYTWNPGALTGATISVTPTITTTYTLNTTDLLGCTATQTVDVAVSNLTVSATASSNTICAGNTTTLTGAGSTTYTWNPGNLAGTTAVVNPTATTLYTVTSTNGLGCTATNTILITVIANPTITATPSPTAICAGNTASLTANGSLTYTWSPGALTGAMVTVTPTVTTTYTLTSDNGIGCTNSETVTIIVNANPTLTLTASSNTICSGSSSTLTASGATSYTWNPGVLTGTTTVVSPTITTTYTVDGDNGLGCTGNNTITINVSTAPTLTISASSTTLCAGSVTLTANGGTTYTWSPVAGATASIVDSPTITTTYTVTSDNGTGCIGTQTITVNVNTIPTLTLSASANTICLGNSTTLNATGATSYTWNPGALTGSSALVSPTIATTYTATGDNGGGCTNTETITISVGPALTVTATASSSTICAGTSATLTGNGATSYTWNPGATTGSTTVVNPTVTTTYTVDADNGSGCIANSTVTINVNAIPTLTISATSTSLCTSGTVTLTASGATTYTWMPLAAVTPSVTDNPTVTTIYTVTGADAIGCTNTETISIGVSITPTVTASSTATTICAGASATLTGNGAASYTWNPGSLTGTTTVVSPSVTTTYTVDGDNGAGCTASNTITINVNAAPSLSIASTSTVLCSAGSITLTASGGTTYTWSPISATTASVVDSPTITTTYTVSSDNGTGCIGTETITVNVGVSPSVSITSSPTGTICVGTTATLTASGASSYTWNPTGATTNTITDAPSVTTTYTITGDNGFGCIGTNTFVLDVAPGASITAVANPTAVCANATVNLSASGAITYTWMPMNISGATVTATPLVSTTYTVLGDNGTCVASSTVFVDIIPGPANVTASVSADITCLTPTVNLFGNTTTSPVTYSWTGPGSYTSTVQNPTGITQGGTYTLEVTDALSSCITTSMVTISTNTTVPGLTALASGSLGCVTTVTLTAASTTTNVLTYNWSGPSSFTSAIQSPTTSVAGDYTVTANDGLTGCNATSTVTVGTGTVLVTFTATASGSLTCIGDVTLTATPSSTNAVTYLWNGPSSFTSTIQSPTTTVAGDYTIAVTDVASGCSSSSIVAVGTNTVGPNLTAVTSGSLGCATSVTLTASTTSTNTLTYAWFGPSSYTAAVQSPTATVAGDYTVNAMDALTGCSSTSTVSVGTNTTIPLLGIAVPGPVLGCNTTVTLSVITIPTPPYHFNWSGPSSFTSTVQSPTTSVAGDYTVTVTDSTNGCSNTVSINVSTNTLVPVFTATAVPATCTGTITNNDGTIIIAGYNGSTDTYDMSQAATYTGTATYLSGNTIPFGGILTNTLVNPSVPMPYTIRVFSNNGCFKDTTVMLTPTTCTVTSGGNVLGMTKAVSTPTFVNNTAYNVTYTVVATNASSANLTNFSVIDDLNTTFPLPTTYSVISAPVVTSLNSSLTANSAYDGSAQNDMLLPATSTLTAGRKDTIVFTVQINPNGFFGPFNNSAIGFGFDGALTISDISNTGFAWDSDNDGDPTNNDTATVVSLIPNTQIGVAKNGIVSEILADKTLDVTYTISIKNLGNDTITFVQLMDTINIPSPAQYVIKSGPSASGSLVANNNYNGNSDIALLNASLSKLAPGQMETITLVLNVTPNGLKSITNIAIGSGIGADGGIAKDSSNTGTESDPNGNGVATENGENIPTVLELPDVELFIPEVFTPDGDGKNDFFVIKGISGRTVKVTVFNRWGSKVYENDAYDNTWNGTPNVSGLMIGNSTLPQGTYYYIIEFEDGADDPVNGYVVLQY
ncbi:MAG: gliding motility-associated C-terminal domain-containing protein [Bacteroidota bacterium]